MPSRVSLTSKSNTSPQIVTRPASIVASLIGTGAFFGRLPISGRAVSRMICGIRPAPSRTLMRRFAAFSFIEAS